jgi:serine phosphatase RsbU (regulator of sigma subunit)
MNTEPLDLLKRRLRTLGAGHVFDEVLAAVRDSAFEITKADAVGIQLVEPRRGSRTLRVTLGHPGARRTGPSPIAPTTPPDLQVHDGDSEGTNEERTAITIPIRLDLTTVALSRWTTGSVEDTAAVDLRHSKYAREVRDVEPQATPTLYLEGLTRSLESARTALETLATEAGRILTDLVNAAEMQKAILPRGRHSGRFVEVDSAMIPCRTIGGDSFEYVHLPSGEFGFAVCDVAGKGAPAALLSGVVQGIFYAESGRGQSPAETLTRVNKELMRRAIDSRFATMFYGVLSEDGALTYCNAAHNPPFLLRGDRVDRLDTGGLMLGAFDQVSYQEGKIVLAPGDWLIVFSDGISEAVNPSGEEFGDHRLLDCVQASRMGTPSVVVAKLLEAVSVFRGASTQNDDVTVLVLRYVTPVRWNLQRK